MVLSFYRFHKRDPTGPVPIQTTPPQHPRWLANSSDGVESYILWFVFGVFVFSVYTVTVNFD